MTDIGFMVRSANPVPDDTQQLTNDELSSVLLLAQQRSGDMDVKEAPVPIKGPVAKKKTGWLVAAAAFGVVIVILGAAMLIGNATSSEPPATTPPTTGVSVSTTEVVQTSGVSSDDVQAVLDAWNIGSEGAVLGTLADDVTVDEAMLDEIVFWTLVGQEWIVAECASDATPTIRCTTENPNPLYEAAGYRPWVWELSMRIEGDSVTSLSASWATNRPDLGDDFSEAWFAYLDWMEANHPTEAAQISFPLEPAMAEPFKALLDEFSSTGGGEPSLDEEAEAIANTLVDAVTAGDEDTILQIFGEARSVVSSDTADSDDRARETGRWVAWALLDSSAEVIECTTLSSGPTRCEIARTSPSDFSSRDPQLVTVQLVLDEADQVDLIKLDLVTGPWVVAESDFGNWVLGYDNPAFTPMFVDFSDPVRTAELFRELHPLWVESDA